MVAYVVERLDDVTLVPGSVLDAMDLMSPFVWVEDGQHRIMVRGVPRTLAPDVPTGIIMGGCSGDGLVFTMRQEPTITPGPGADDAGGCEDPTVLVTDGGCLVYYTGVDAAHLQGAMMLATGPTLASLRKRAVILKAPPGEGNIKEATLTQADDGSWRLFYEYAANDASRIGIASGPSPAGPWTVLADPFGIRADSWDNWHLSTGPIVTADGHDPVMFYNGATHDARWRIGWITFDPGFTRVTARGVEPLLVPPPAIDRSATDIAFAASATMEQRQIAVYFSLEDRKLCRALVARYDRATI